MISRNGLWCFCSVSYTLGFYLWWKTNFYSLESEKVDFKSPPDPSFGSLTFLRIALSQMEAWIFIINYAYFLLVPSSFKPVQTFNFILRIWLNVQTLSFNLWELFFSFEEVLNFYLPQIKIKHKIVKSKKKKNKG